MSPSLYSAHRVCRACGEEFDIPMYVIEWGWRYGAEYCCSYHCMKALERSDLRRDPYAPKPRKKTGPKAGTVQVHKPISDHERVMICKMHSSGMSLGAICRQTHRCMKTVRMIVRGGVQNAG